jgi:Pentapeptide repeats (8 copies)
MAGRFRPRRRGLVALACAAGLVAVCWLATAPWLAGQWPRLLAAGLFLVVFVVPRLQHELRTGVLQGLAVVAVVAAVVVTWQQLEVDRRQLGRQVEAAGQAQAAERFARALDQLGSEQLDVRLGGIYGLERVAARASEAVAGQELAAYRPPWAADPPPEAWWAAQDRLQVFEILSAYVRTSSHRPPSVSDGAPSSLQLRQADVSAAVTALARRTVLAGDPPLDLRGSQLAGARLGRAQLAGADLAGADVRLADLQLADLAGAHLVQAQLCGAQFQGANLRGANLAGARASNITRWPSGFDWRAAGAELVKAC